MRKRRKKERKPRFLSTLCARLAGLGADWGLRSDVATDARTGCRHKSILKEFKHALVWGTSVKYSPMKVGKDHVLNDEDVVQIVKRI